ncbi:MAG: hypothetical protein E7214_11575 [Clostridium sp.]|nr:hypothetical protein [Clostridium sp.]
MSQKVRSILNYKTNKSSDKSDIYLEDNTDIHICISKFDYIKKFKYPIRNVDYFFLELINVVGDFIIKEIDINSLDIKKILFNVLDSLKDFYNNCDGCECNCLKHPYESIKFDFEQNLGVDAQTIPSIMRQKIKINFFYLELVSVLGNSINNELEKIIEGDIAFDISSDVYYYILDYISFNCWENCHNKCIEKHNKNSYCEFCSMTNDKLPCPLKNEISLEDISCRKDDLMLCTRVNI